MMIAVNSGRSLIYFEQGIGIGLFLTHVVSLFFAEPPWRRTLRFQGFKPPFV